MSRTAINFFLDALLLLTFLLLLWSAVVTQFVFPPGEESLRWTLWGWGVYQWRTFQFGVLCALTMGLLVHLMLHWSWICGVASNWIGRARGQSALRFDEGTRTLIGVGTLIVALHLVGGGIAAAVLMIQRAS